MTDKAISIYDANEVMRIIGKQPCSAYITEDFLTILKEHCKLAAQLEVTDVALNFYVLGVLTGKRLDRAKKHHRDFATFMQQAHIAEEG